MPAVRISADAIEAVVAVSTDVRLSQDVVEVLWTKPTPSPTTVTGGGVTQRVVEVLMAVAADARVSSVAIEVLFSPAATGESGTVGGGSDTTSYGIVT